MNTLGFLDYLLITAAAILSWRMYYAAQPPPPPEAEAKQPARPTAANPALLHSDVQLPPNTAAPLAGALRRICVASGYNKIETFLDGARLAYEEVTGAFARGDMAPQGHLLAEPVRETFDSVIAARQVRGESMELMFIGFRSCTIADAGMADGLAWIAVRYVAQLVSATRDGDGKIVAGDPRRVAEITETWTFERELRAATPRWLLTATVSEA